MWWEFWDFLSFIFNFINGELPDVQATEEFCRFLGERRRGRGNLLDLIQAQVLLYRREHQLIGDQPPPAGHAVALNDPFAVLETNILRPVHEYLIVHVYRNNK